MSVDVADPDHQNNAQARPDAAVAVILVAAGSGTRLGAGIPKAFVECAGQTLLARSLDAVIRLERPVQIIVVAPRDRMPDARETVTALVGSPSEHIAVVEGGATRQLSVSAGLANVLPGTTTILVHDAARALTPTTLFESVIEAVHRTGHGVVPGLPLVDTIKSVEGVEVTTTVDRSPLRAVQTPQGFPAAMLISATREASEDASAPEHTDDASVVSSRGHRVDVVAGDELAFKITTPWDLRRAESIVRDRSSGGEPSTRTGIGLDVHAFDDDLELWLAGLFWPGEPGLSGHSDGDAVCHAIVVALLSAASLGDIGSMFGTDDPALAGARGEVFVRAAVQRLRVAGWAVDNVAVQVTGNRPRLSPRRREAEGLLSELVGAPVSLAASTSDALGFTGRGEGVAALATALISRR